MRRIREPPNLGKFGSGNPYHVNPPGEVSAEPTEKDYANKDLLRWEKVDRRCTNKGYNYTLAARRMRSSPNKCNFYPAGWMSHWCIEGGESAM